MYNQIVIGIDQSYQNTGVSIVADGKIKKVSSVKLDNLKNNSERRARLKETLTKLIPRMQDKTGNVIIICERIRLSSQGFVNIDYIKSIGALNACIVDIANKFGVKVFSVDTRCWKAQVVGTSKPQENDIGIDKEKWPTIKYVIKKGFEQSIMVEVSKQKKKGVFVRGDKRYTYDNDAADSCCIALFGFIGDKEKLKEEH